MSESEIDLNGEMLLSERKTWDKGKLLVLAIFSVYFLKTVIWYGDGWCLLDGMNIWIHEAGHFLFLIFGNDFLTIAGGTLMQLLMPLLFVGYFIYTEQRFSAALTLFWAGESLANVSVYMRDAVAMVLPLIGNGGPESHDWHNMFLMLGLLPYAAPLSEAVHLLAILIVCGASGWGISCCRRKKGRPA